MGWLFSCVLVAFGAGEKGRNPLGWFLGALLLYTPLLALIALAALPRRREDY